MESISPQYYRRIIDCPLRAFIDCACDGNLSALTIAGFPDPADLQEAWAEITAQYSEEIGDNRQRLIVNVFRQIVKLKNALFQIDECIKVLQDTHVTEFADTLNRLLGTSFKFDPRFPEDYDKSLKRCKNRSKGLELDLELKMAHFEAIEGEKEQGQPATREGFIQTLISLSDHARFPLHDSITVFEYVTRIKRLNKDIEGMERAMSRK